MECNAEPPVLPRSMRPGKRAGAEEALLVVEIDVREEAKFPRPAAELHIHQRLGKIRALPVDSCR